MQETICNHSSFSLTWFSIIWRFKPKMYLKYSYLKTNCCCIKLLINRLDINKIDFFNQICSRPNLITRRKQNTNKHLWQALWQKPMAILVRCSCRGRVGQGASVSSWSEASLTIAGAGFNRFAEASSLRRDLILEETVLPTAGLWLWHLALGMNALSALHNCDSAGVDLKK